MTTKKHRILLQTNPTHIKTGLAENARNLLKFLYATGKYEIAHYCSQVSEIDGNLKYTPWKSYGAIPSDQNVVNQLNSDQGKARDATYGGYNIDKVIQDFKPTIWIGSDDIWAFPNGSYADKPWYNKINSILHVTVDSLPVLEQAFDQAKKTKNYFTWAKFASDKMKEAGADYSHVRNLYGAIDTQIFSPITDAQKNELKASFGLAPETVIFLYVFRNQLRKQAPQCLEAFAKFKKENPSISAKLYLHTSFSEKSMGWDIPRLTQHFGIDPKDVLCTYVCKQCGKWHVGPYMGEDLNCPYCGGEKTMVTPTISNGVATDEMKFVYGISDACLSPMTSGGLELHNVQALLCSKPLATTNYSSGQDFCEQGFVTPIRHSTTNEAGTNFIKAANDPSSICDFMRKITRMSKIESAKIGTAGRAWALKTFSVEVVGQKWMDLFDSMPITEWSDSIFDGERKNDNFIFPEGLTDIEFITSLYKNILISEEKITDSGHLHWQQKLKEGITRRQIYDYFIGVARSDNQKIGAPPAPDFSSLLDMENGRKRAIFVVKESIGDIIISSALFRSFRKQHPDTDLYFACDDKFKDVLKGSKYIHKIIPYLPFMDNEMACIGTGIKIPYFHYYYNVCSPTQKTLNYLSHPEPVFNVNYV